MCYYKIKEQILKLSSDGKADVGFWLIENCRSNAKTFLDVVLLATEKDWALALKYAQERAKK